MQTCVFCKIIAGEIPSPRLIETGEFICIRDIQPQAKVHLLVVPKRHVASLQELFPVEGSGSPDLAAESLRVATAAARAAGIGDGFRVVINTGAGGGQTVFHYHVHVLGGGELGESFG